MQASDLSFRDLCHKLCYISNGKNFKAFAEHLPNADESDGVLAYGYIDHTAGLSFEILACAKLGKDNNITIFEGNENVSLKYRFGSIFDCDVFMIEDESLRKRFSDKIEMIEENYQVSASVSDTRNIAVIDESRSQEYPDDVWVILVRGNNQPEGCWVRCEGIGENGIYGILLNEPNADFSVHSGDGIEFGVVEDEESIMCVAVFE